MPPTDTTGAGAAFRPGDASGLELDSVPDLTVHDAHRLALLCSASVASVYYMQPLLAAVGASFEISAALIGVIPMIAQVAVGLGIVLILPLGDAVDNRTIVVGAMLGQVVALLAMAWAPTITLFLIAAALLGLLTVAPYLIPAYAARRTASDRRGRITATMTQGIILGILFARVVGGYVSAEFGWRLVYLFAAVVVVASMRFCVRALPAERPRAKLQYTGLLRSLPSLLLREPVLRNATLTQALLFGTFGSLWIALGLHIQSAAFSMSSAVVGSLGLLGLITGVIAPRSGRLIDRLGPDKVVRLGIVLTILAWVLMAVGGSSIAILCVGIVMLDIGASATHIAKQTAIFGLEPGNRSRYVTVYIVGQYLGAGLLALMTGLAWAAGGWLWVCLLGTATTVVALALNARPAGKRASKGT